MEQSVSGQVRRLRRVTAATTALAVVAFLVAAVVVVVVAHDRWDPLGAYPVQDVLDTTIAPGESVRVVGVKCVRSDTTVTVRGAYSWQSLDPSGTFVEGGEGVAVRYPRGARPEGPKPDKRGCTTFRFENPVPGPVAQRAADVCSARGVPSVWALVGRETPVRSGGEDGVTRAWRTERFTLLCG